MNTFLPEGRGGGYERYAGPGDRPHLLRGGLANFHLNPPSEVDSRRAIAPPCSSSGRTRKTRFQPRSRTSSSRVRALAVCRPTTSSSKAGRTADGGGGWDEVALDRRLARRRARRGRGSRGRRLAARPSGSPRGRGDHDVRASPCGPCPRRPLRARLSSTTGEPVRGGRARRRGRRSGARRAVSACSDAIVAGRLAAGPIQ